MYHCDQLTVDIYLPTVSIGMTMVRDTRVCIITISNKNYRIYLPGTGITMMVSARLRWQGNTVTCVTCIAPGIPRPLRRRFAFLSFHRIVFVLSLSLPEYPNNFGTVVSYQYRTIVPKLSVRYPTLSSHVITSLYCLLGRKYHEQPLSSKWTGNTNLREVVFAQLQSSWRAFLPWPQQLPLKLVETAVRAVAIGSVSMSNPPTWSRKIRCGGDSHPETPASPGSARLGRAHPR